MRNFNVTREIVTTYLLEKLLDKSRGSYYNSEFKNKSYYKKKIKLRVIKNKNTIHDKILFKLKEKLFFKII